ncbi:MAG: redoxin domain-containing protein, partial [Lysobacteraceae bacterium]
MSFRSRVVSRVAVLAAAIATVPAFAGAQTALKVGDVAPDFTVTTVTAKGVDAKPFKLSEHKGETVVLAFFPKARTSG